MKYLGLVFSLSIIACGDADKEPSSEPSEPSNEVIDADGDGVSVDLDCDDGDASVYPDADEICDGIDNNCDDIIDNDASDALTFYEDADGDGFGDSEITEDACEAPEGFTDNMDDCDDLEGTVNPDADEICDGMDNNCDGSTDEGLEAIVSYIDTDGDGFGSDDEMNEDCLIPEGFVDNMDDCDDGSADIGSNLEDMDCDGTLDLDDDDVDGDGYLVDEECDDMDASTVQLIDSVETESIDADGDGVFEKVVTYTYLENGQVSSKSEIYDIDEDEVDDEIETIYTYNEDGTLNSGTVSYDYAIDGTDEITYTFVLTSDADGNVLTSIGNGTRIDGSTFNYTYTYTYDTNGNMLTQIFEADWSGSGTTEQSSMTTNTYDPVTGDLMSESLDALNADGEELIDGIPEEVHTYGYDGDGNLSNEQVTFDDDSDGTIDTTLEYEYVYLSDGRIDSYTYTYDGAVTSTPDPSDGDIDATITYNFTYNSDDLLEMLEASVEFTDYPSSNYIDTTMYTYNEDGELLITEIDDASDGTIDVTYTNEYNAQGQLVLGQNENGTFIYTYISCPE